MDLVLLPVSGALEREQAMDLRRSVLCGELNFARDLVDDGLDAASTLWLGRLGEQPVATLRLRQAEALWVLELMVVLPRYRRQGHGRSAVAIALKEAARLGAAELTVLAPRPSHAFFEACGFQSIRQDAEIVVLQRQV